MLSQLFGQRYEPGSTLVTSNLLCGVQFNAESVLYRAFLNEGEDYSLRRTRVAFSMAIN